MTRPTPLLLLVLILSVVGTTIANPQIAANGRQHRVIIKRAGASLENISTTSTEVTTSTTQSVISTSSSIAVTSGSITSLSSSNVVSSTSSEAVSTSSSSAVPSSSTSSVSSSSSDIVESVSSTASTSNTDSITQQSTTSSTGSTTSIPVRVTQTTKTTTSLKGASTTYLSGNSQNATKSGGLSKGAIIGIVVGGIIVLIAIGWTLFRKLKLKPTRKFDTRKKPVDFSPANLPDPFFEKTSRRPTSIDSTSSADRARRQYVSELDAYEQQQHVGPDAYPLNDSLVPGVPAHDFTAGPAASYPPYGTVPPHPHQYDEYETGYANLQRGPSNGAEYAGVGAGGGVQPYPAYGVGGGGGGYPQEGYPPQAYDHGYHDDGSMPVGSEGLGRPTQGAGPYYAATHFAGGH